MKQYHYTLAIVLSICNYMLADQSLNFVLNDSGAERSETIFLFSHGLRSTHQQAYIIAKNLEPSTPGNHTGRWLVQEPFATFDYPDAVYHKHQCDNNHVNLGQEEDIKQLHAAVMKITELYPTAHIVLIGISRGASTILNFAAEHHYPNIKALIVESAFDHMDNVIKHLLRRFHVHWVPFSKRAAQNILHRQFPLYDKNGIFPIKVVHKIPNDLPIMLIHSKYDNVVPVISSRNLYIKLRESRHDNVYLLELVSGRHAHVINGEDGDYYYYVMHAFYQKFGAPHDQLAAQRGLNFLPNCQPSIGSVRQRIKESKRSMMLDQQDDEENEFLWLFNPES